MSVAAGSHYASGMCGRWVNSRYFTALLVIAMAASLAQSAWACAAKLGPADPPYGAMIGQGVPAPVGGTVLMNLHRRACSTGCVCPGMCIGMCGWMPAQTVQASQPQMRQTLLGHTPESGAIAVLGTAQEMPRAQGPPLIVPVPAAAHVYLATRRLRL